MRHRDPLKGRFPSMANTTILSDVHIEIEWEGTGKRNERGREREGTKKEVKACK